MPIDLIIQLLSGAAGGNIAGALFKNLNLGWLWNSVAGVAGGGLGGTILSSVLGAGMGAAKSGMDPMAIISSLASGGIGGGVVMAVVGLIKQMMNNK
jgi:hypothetical protein